MRLSTRFTSLALVLAASAMMSQETTGVATGQVADKQGKPMAGAVVRLNSNKLLGERTTQTNEHGQWRIPLLPNGDFTLTVTASGYITVKAQFHVYPGQTSRQDVALPLEKIAAATVEVTDSAAIADKTDTVTQTIVTNETINTISSGGIAAMTFLAPAVTGNLNVGMGQANDVPRIRGGMGHLLRVLQDGANIVDEGAGFITDTTTINDMIESIAIIQSPLNARYGNGDGGMISMVTAKGTNTFNGSVRLSYSKAYWSDSGTNYPMRNGQPSQDWTNIQGDDPMRSYDVTLRGPIWKDHITFAYGGQFQPVSTSLYMRGQGGGYGSPFNTGLPASPVGTWYHDPATGNVITTSNVFGMDEVYPATTGRKFNQFGLYFQLGQNHQVEWSYSANEVDWIYDVGRLEKGVTSGDNMYTHVWNLGYKGIIGSNGLLEARFTHQFKHWPKEYDVAKPPIFVNYLPTQYGSTYTNMVDAYNAGAVAFNISGFNSDESYPNKTDQFSLNYKLVADFHGEHQIDVGVAHDKFSSNSWVGGARNQFFAPGLTGPDNGSLSNQYIVFDATTATLGDLGVTGSTTPVRGSSIDGSYIPWSQQGNSYGVGLIPRWNQQWGTGSGAFSANTDSYYLNDLWTLSANHSVMGGIRVDRFTLKDEVSTIINYSQPTLRFEYKWDVNGDQARLFNASIGQFHAREPIALFSPYIHGGLANSTQWYWNKPNPNAGQAGVTSGTPYLVDQAEFLNTANYGLRGSTTLAGLSYQADPNFKAPVSTEYTIGFKRNYKSGGSWRLTGIYKEWKNLFDIFPGTGFTDATGTNDFHKILRNDPRAERTYKGLEFEWTVPLSKRALFGGNYAYTNARTNASMNIEAPSQGLSVNWRDYLVDTIHLPMGQVAPSYAISPEHTLNAYFNYDLSIGKIKSNIAFRLQYASGQPEANAPGYIWWPVWNSAERRTVTINVPAPIIPGYTNLVDTMQATLYTDGGRSTNQEIWTTGLKYNLELPIWRSARWFMEVDVFNPFNIKTWPTYSVSPGTVTDGSGNLLQAAYSYRAQADLRGVGSGRTGGRYLTLQTGVKF